LIADSGSLGYLSPFRPGTSINIEKIRPGIFTRRIDLYRSGIQQEILPKNRISKPVSKGFRMVLQLFHCGRLKG